MKSLKIEKLNTIKMICFYLAFMIELAIVLVDKSDLINPFEGRLFQITFLLFGFKVFLTKYSNKEWLLITGFVILGAISYFVTGRNEIIRVVMFVAATKEIQARQLMKVTFYTILIGVTCTMALSILGIYGKQAVTANYGRGSIETRYCYGLGHPNSLHCMIWSILVGGLYLYHQKIRKYQYIVLFLANIILYLFTTSRTGLIIVTFTIVFSALYTENLLKKYTKLFGIAGIALVLSAFAFSVLCAAFGMENPVLLFFDQYLTGRIFFSALQGGVQNWSLFSKPDNTLYFDMGYVRLFYWYGIIPGIVYVVVNAIMIWDARKREDYMAYMVIVVFTIYTVVEAHSISVYFPRNLMLLLLAGRWSVAFHVQDNQEKYCWQLPGFR